MAGPIAFLAGLLMIGGAAFSSAAERNAYKKPRTYSNGHPNFSSVNSSVSAEIRDSIYGKVIPGTLIPGPPQRKLLPVGGFDVERIEKEIGFYDTLNLINTWLILELGYNTSIDEERMKKYCWSGDYMSPYLSAALGMREKYPTDTIEQLSSRYHHLGNCAHFDTMHHSLAYEDHKKYRNGVILEGFYKNIVDEVIETLKGIELPQKLKNNKRLGLWGDESINDQHTHGRSLISSIHPDSNFDEPKETMDNCYKGPKEDYVDYLKWRYEGKNEYMFIEEKAREVFKNNSYLALCEKYKEAALEFAKTYAIEDYKLTKWDVCQILRAAPVGLKYSSINRSWDLCERGPNHKLVDYRYMMLQERFLYVKKIFDIEIGFFSSKLEQLNEMYLANLYSTFEALVKDDDLFCDFLTCYLTENRNSKITKLIWEKPKPNNFTDNDRRRIPDFVKEREEEYAHKVDIRKRTVKALAKARQRARACVKKIPQTKEPQLRLRYSSESQN